ncbi:hypothetical protein [Geomesophilobacter sediminis]|uniref:Uncharacterized protein n=1 Tax=Geomesophilobacter sediminis TaxID=2798584 RepID=A0A8J7IYC9_9BACT|nr:hypothetical protein [Geomesophilobacter sediminis]MBJ6725147.1 hypothetical protein [Geomesophilobacter sediminis]
MQRAARGEDALRYRVATLAIASALLLALTTIANAEPPPTAPAKSGKKRLLLFAKNPSSWTVVKGGANGNLLYRASTGDFTLAAQGLAPRSRYALIRYADRPPQAEVLARGTSDDRGRLALRGRWENWTRKFWLVSGEDVEGTHGSARLVNWRPERYLFEEKQLGTPCDCPEPEVNE